MGRLNPLGAEIAMAHILILVHAELVGFVQSLWRQGHGPVGANIAYFVIPDLIRDPTFL